MPLPSSNSLWPPQHLAPMYTKMAEWSAWYSGDPARIIDAYAGQPQSATTGTPWWRFWSRARSASSGAQRAMLHVPVASDLAGLSASLLFGELPRIRIPSAHETPSRKGQRPEAGSDEEKAEQRLMDVLDRGEFWSRLVEAGESSAAIGGVYVYPAWDKSVCDVPFMAIAQSDQAVPEFRSGFLSSVTFFRTVIVNGNQVWRHVEVHETEGEGSDRKAYVLHGLYEGTGLSLGVARDLGAQQATANFSERVDLPFGELDVQYVPNLRPNRLWRASGLGVADIQGSESLLDSLDETYASWMRDVRLAKARIIVPHDYLRVDPSDPDRVPAMDIDQEIYVSMDMDPGLAQDARAMLAHQFDIRYQAHRETANDIIDRIVSNAGYTPITAGIAKEAAGTGAALRVREHRTLLTLKRKSTHWRSALKRLLHQLVEIDAAEFGSGVRAFQPSVETADSIMDSPLELAQTALAMKSAEATSIETRVRILHPDWSESEVDAEVKRIGDERPEQPTIPPTAFGDEESDQASGAAKVPINDRSTSRPGTPRPGGIQPRRRAE